MQLQCTHAHSVSLSMQNTILRLISVVQTVHVKNTSLQKISDNFVYYVTVHG